MHRLLVLCALLLALSLSACGDDEEPSGGGAAAPAAEDFAAVEREARGQTVRIWMFSGNDLVNSFFDKTLQAAVKDKGVTIKRVPIEDTEAVDRIAAEKRAGKDEGGAVDLYWSNGPNFAKGKQLGLWEESWAPQLPNYRKYVDPANPLVTKDFGIDNEGQESPWFAAAFQFAHDEAKVSRPPTTFAELLAYAKANPGRFTYPAPPDFTGTAFVSQVVQHFGGDKAFAYLKELKPLQWRKGDAFPKDEAELTDLFGNDQVDFAMAYDPNYVFNNVRTGKIAKTSRPFVLEGKSLQNYSYMSLAYNAKSKAGAKVVANALLSPEVQAKINDPKTLGNPPVIDLKRLSEQQRAAFPLAEGGRYRLESLGETLQELPVDEVPPLQERWKREVLAGS